MTLGSSNTRNASSRSQNSLAHDGGHICINMVRYVIDVATQSHNYGSLQTIIGPKPPPLETPLHIDKPDPLPHIPKGVLKRSSHNPNARATQNYSIVKDLGQTPCVMSALEVLQTCPTQRNAFLSSLGALDPSGSKVIKFDVADVKPHFPYHVAFQIHVEGMNVTIKHTLIDEGASTFIMSLSCWKSIGSLPISQSMIMLTTFDGHSFKSHGILPTFLVQLGGNTVEVEVKVVDAPLDYNLLWGIIGLML
jgi:hypothetical protein